ncbi:MAG: DUF1501 domain-containing protein [Lewinellaceae bacterium]|nr:DUF1501 domain-containing protein [Lewinellaceae bacterium]
MKRRNFLKIFPAAGVTPFVVNGFPMRPFANSKIARIMSTCDGVEDRVLILIQLKGGNDGLNMVIPVQQYDLYAALRPSIRIPETGANKYLDLDNTLSAPDKVGLHPALTGIKDLYDNGQASIVQGVGYADMNQSHFKGTDLWLSGGDGTPANNNIPSGWMGRALQALYPDVQGAPTADMPDPLGIQIGDPNPSLGFHTETQHQNVINLSGQDPAGFYSLIQTIGGAPLLNVPNSDYGEEIAYIQGVENSLSLYSQRISDTFNAGSNALNDYPDTTLANQLKTIARLISGGCKTKIYLCSMGGFDTHGAQVIENNTTIGNHANLLQNLSDSVKYFFDDLKELGIDEQVVACTFSEFGRTAKENGSLGSDHGTLAPMFLFGKNVQAGVNGTNVNLGVLTQDNQLMDMQFDYRQVFTSLLQDWLGANNFVLEQTMFEGYVKLPLVDSAYVVSPDCYFGTTSAFDPYQGKRVLSVFPNPASISAEVTFQSQEHFDALLTVHSLGGSLISATRVQVQPGNNLFYIDVAPLPAGPYFIRLEDKVTGRAEVVKLSVAR